MIKTLGNSIAMVVFTLMFIFAQAMAEGDNLLISSELISEIKKKANELDASSEELHKKIIEALNNTGRAFTAGIENPLLPLSNFFALLEKDFNWKEESPLATPLARYYFKSLVTKSKYLYMLECEQFDFRYGKDELKRRLAKRHSKLETPKGCLEISYQDYSRIESAIDIKERRFDLMGNLERSIENMNSFSNPCKEREAFIQLYIQNYRKCSGFYEYDKRHIIPKK